MATRYQFVDDSGETRLAGVLVPDPGGSSAGVPVVRAFPFAYNTAGILTGATLYTPTVGDVLIDAWIEVDTPWNGTTPLADLGPFFNSETFGIFQYSGGAIVLDNEDQEWEMAHGPQGFLIASNDGSVLSFSNIDAYLPGGPIVRYIPGKFTAAHPWKIVVSQTGAVGGASPGASQGSAVLYLVTATPAT